MNEQSNLKYFFIVGVGRSGTSLLMSMLNAHPDIALPPESHFLYRYVIGNPGFASPDLKIQLMNDHRFQRLGFGEAAIDEMITALADHFSVGGFYQELLTKYAELKKVKIVGDKAPKNIEYLPVIKKLFPDGIVLHIIRDPRDVYLSRTKAAWSAGRSTISHLVAYRTQFHSGRHLGPKLFGSNYFEVHYEDLLKQPAQELSKICKLLGATFTEEMLSFVESSKDLVSQEELPWKKETLRPIMVNNINKWKKDLPPGKVALIESVCSEAFRMESYTKAHTGSNVLIVIKSIFIAGIAFLYRIVTMIRIKWTMRSLNTGNQESHLFLD